MRTRTSQFRAASVMACLVLAAALCGASPQAEGERRAMPRPQAPSGDRVGGRATFEGARPGNPMTPSAGAASPGTRHPGPRTATVEPRPGSAPQVNRVALYPGTRTVVPPAWPRCTVLPTRAFWIDRDLQAEIKWLSRRGFIPVTPIGDAVGGLEDYVQMPSGWRAYGISVPAGGTVQVEVQHEKLGWFRLMLMDKWGVPGPGMLQAAIAHQPVLVTYKNPNKEATAIYVIVDDPAWWSDAKHPYTLAIRRDWDPAKTDLSQVKMVAGLWGASPSVSAEFHRPTLTGPAVYPH